jgi:hypothetical protein
MKKIIAYYILPGLLLFSCIKPEIIPAPEEKVELTAYFKGKIKGKTDETDVKWYQNLDDYDCEPTKTKTTFQEQGKSSQAVYFAEIKSSSVKTAIKIGIGSVLWNYTATEDPTKLLFDNFMTKLNSSKIKYSKDAVDGFEVKFTDKQGRAWFSSPTSVNIQNVEFISVKQESDVENDYSKFVASFNCWVYRTYTEDTIQKIDSLKIEEGQFKGWFVR